MVINGDEFTSLSEDVDSLISELDDIEAALGFKNNFEDITFPAVRPVVPPPVKHVEIPKVEPLPRMTRADIAKLDDEQLEQIIKQFDRINEMQAEVAAMKEVIDERLNVDFNAMYENIMEKTNIEAIKTYRNIQAVIVEENAKQNSALFGIDGKSDSLKRRLNNVMIFSIVSFVVSILVMLMIILPALGVDIF